jgi:hypothetical protein
MARSGSTQAGFINHQHRIGVGQRFQRIIAYDVTQRIRLSTAAVFVQRVVRYLLGDISDFAVACVALRVEADVADRRPVSDLT